MKILLFILAISSLFSCSNNNKDVYGIAKENKSLKASETDNSNWVIYRDTVNMGFIITFKYPRNLFAEHFENAECIGKKIRIIDDGPNTTMDCCIWMEEAIENSTESDLQYNRKAINNAFSELHDSVLVANTPTLRVRFFDKNNQKTLKENFYLNKFGTLFFIDNKGLSEKDFEYFLQSITIEKE